MTSISFIVTTYNIAPYVEQCLKSLIDVIRPGDEIILIDDGSTDQTLAKVQSCLRTTPVPAGAEFRFIPLGTNTYGGVGIGANIGLCDARCDTIFFVDGDDWIDFEGFQRARARWERLECDILFTNYRNYDQAKDSIEIPADMHRWASLEAAQPIDALRRQALAFIAVPWRKFYRRAFIEENGLRFPEGDFFFEDNPFHWAVCMAARKIEFVNEIICYHRVNRPGQTMASTGIELAAFCTHFETISSMLPPDDVLMQAEAARWLIGNMSWHISRLSPTARHPYFTACATALERISEKVWNDHLVPSDNGTFVWMIASRLRSGDIWGVIDSLQTRDLLDELAVLKRRLLNIEYEAQKLSEDVRGLVNVERYRALQNF